MMCRMSTRSSYTTGHGITLTARLQLASCTHGNDANDNNDMNNIEIIGRQDCIKAVKELNRETARYYSLVVALGGSHDSELLREELKKSRRKAFELARQNKAKLLPHLRSNHNGQKNNEGDDFTKLWNLFSACLEVLMDQLQKTLQLERMFPLHTGHSVFINTGIIEPVSSHKCYTNISVEPLDVPTADKKVLEREECRLLEREIVDIQEMLVEMNQRVDIKPWTIEPQIDVDKLAECSKSLDSTSEGTSAADVVSVREYDRARRRKCACLMAIILLSVIVFATVLGLCIALLT